MKLQPIADGGVAAEKSSVVPAVESNFLVKADLVRSKSSSLCIGGWAGCLEEAADTASAGGSWSAPGCYIHPPTI